MGLGSIVKLFMPKDRVFFALFEEVSATLVEMVEVFMKALNEQDLTKRVVILKSLKDLEHKNDHSTHKIFIELGRNFITPFDREDIHYLATALDDIADHIWEASKRMVTHDVVENDEYINAMGAINVKSVTALRIAVTELRNMKDMRAIAESCLTINSLENESDDLLDKAMLALFSSKTDYIGIIKKKDVYEMLEIVADKCEDAANVIESIIIKYS
jgi:uncharacterized protein